MDKFIKNFEDATRTLIDKFCTKHEADMEYAVCDDITGVLCIRDCYFNLSDIYYDMKEDKPKGMIYDWYYHCMDHAFFSGDDHVIVNYRSYCMGARCDVPIYELTSDHNIYFRGKSVLLKNGDKFRLAGRKLSSFGDNSPFHYEDDIIRLPNSILKSV